MSPTEPTPRAGSIAPVLIAAVTLVVLLFFWAATRPPSPAEWALSAREAILRGAPLPPPPPGITVQSVEGKTRLAFDTGSTASSPSPSSVVLVSATIPRSELGLFENDLMRISRIAIPGNASDVGIHWKAPPVWNLRIIGSSSIILPWTISGSEPLMLPASPAEILAFIASAGGSWIQPDPTSAGRLIDRLKVTTTPPRFQMPTAPQDVAALMGPLFQAGKLPAHAGLRLPPQAFRLPSDPLLLPPAQGLTFEGIRLAAPPEFSWDQEFRRSIAGIATLAFLTDLWERRAQTLATWLPALSDEIGPLLGSGFLRFNRPDLLPATASVLTPMDEINLLRAIHAAQADTTPVTWYPRLAPPATPAADPFARLATLARTFPTPDALLEFLRNHGSDPFDHLLLLENGDLTLTEIPGAGFRLIVCGSGSITLKGPCTARNALLICRGGTIAIGTGATRIPALFAIPDINGNGGTIRFDHPATLTEPVVAETLELTENSGAIVIQPDTHPTLTPLALLLPVN